jgi:hypothetical protein
LVRAELSSEDVPCSCRSACKHGTHSFLLQAAQRGQKQAVMTQAEEDDPVKDKYGDAPMVQSREVASRPYTDIGTLDASCADKEVCDLSILKARKQVITCTFSLTITGNPVCELLSLRESIVHTHTHARTHTHTNIYTHIHILITHICTCTHTYTHTSTHSTYTPSIALPTHPMCHSLCHRCFAEPEYTMCVARASPALSCCATEQPPFRSASG